MGDLPALLLSIFIIVVGVGVPIYGAVTSRPRSQYYKNESDKNQVDGNKSRRKSQWYDKYVQSENPIQSHLEGTKPNLYINHCWNCHTTVDSRTNIKCPHCGWYICESCGSCEYGCSYGKLELKKSKNLESKQSVKSQEKHKPKSISDQEKKRLESIRDEEEKERQRLESIRVEEEKERQRLESIRVQEEKERQRLESIRFQKEVERQKSESLQNLRVGNTLLHKKFGELRITYIEDNRIHIIDGNNSMKIFKKDQSLFQFVDRIKK